MPDPQWGGDNDGLTLDALLAGVSPYACTLADALQVDSLCSISGVVLTVSGMMLDVDEGLRPFQFTHTPNSNRTVASTRQGIGRGWLLRARVVATAGTPLIGQCFARLSLCRGQSSSAIANGTITSGYVTANTDTAWPSLLAQAPLDGEGVPLSITVATPAAGADWSQTVPTGARWKLVAITAQLVTAVAVANRLARVIVDDGASTLFEVPNPAAQAASLTVQYTYGQGAGGPMTADTSVIEAPIPNDLYLPAGFRIRSATGALQAADQWSNIRLLVQEWLEGN